MKTSATRILLCALTYSSILIAPPASAQDSNDAKPFLPTWKLLNSQEKQQFIAGYLQCWKDTSAILSIAIEYSNKDPKQAAAALESLRTLYGLSGARADMIVPEIDAFFGNPDNRNATLSKAITAAKQKLP